MEKKTQENATNEIQSQKNMEKPHKIASTYPNLKNCDAKSGDNEIESSEEVEAQKCNQTKIRMIHKSKSNEQNAFEDSGSWSGSALGSLGPTPSRSLSRAGLGHFSA